MHAQASFHMPMIGTSRLRLGEIILDFFAGGGGASTGLSQALGRDPDIAVNHDAEAISMHAANHPYTRHHREDVWHIDPVAEVGGRYVGWFHASPDCTDHSQAKGGQPRDRPTRSLSWVVVKVAGKLRRGYALGSEMDVIEVAREIEQPEPEEAPAMPADLPTPDFHFGTAA